MTCGEISIWGKRIPLEYFVYKIIFFILQAENIYNDEETDQPVGELEQATQ